MQENETPKALQTWFVIHFAVDMLFAIPMMLVPVGMLALFGWQEIDPIMTRLVAAALFGIGIASYLERNASVDVFKAMLNLKIIWSTGAIIGVGYSLLAGAQGSPLMGWLVWAVFLFFNIVWVYWRRRLKG